MLDHHKLSLQLSRRRSTRSNSTAAAAATGAAAAAAAAGGEAGKAGEVAVLSKLVVRNVAFEATRKVGGA